MTSAKRPTKGPTKGQTKAPKCLICAKPSVADHAPFCSDRCQKIDLHRWLGGAYAIATEEGPETADEDWPDTE